MPRFACYFGYLGLRPFDIMFKPPSCYISTFPSGDLVSKFAGISYLSSEIATDVYLNLAINGLLELIPIALATVVASKYHKRQLL